MQAAAKTRQALRSLDVAAIESWDLRLTVVFHPELERLGASLSLGTWTGDHGFVLSATVMGRNSPLLDDGKPLSEAHVSRRALGISKHSSGLRLTNLSDTSPTRLGPDDAASMSLTLDELKQGIGLRFGHGIVGFVRLIPLRETDVDSSLSHEFLGVSDQAKQVRRLIALAARSDLPVLLLGDTGVGKDVAANAIHRLSDRSGRSFERLNMASIPDSLAEAELFGTSKGAFTGAIQRDGAFVRAHGGTIFLDEVGDTAPFLQPKLLRVLEQGEIPIVGGRNRLVDVRLIAATELAVSESQGFRQSLLHRLSGIVIKIPNLSERQEDLGLLARSIEIGNAENGGKNLFGEVVRSPLLAAAWGRFFHKALHYSWTGNVRELKLAIRRYALEVGDDQRFGLATSSEALVEQTKDVDDEQLLTVHRACDYEVAETARRLSLSRQAIYRRLNKLPNIRIASEVSDHELVTLIDRFGNDANRISQFAGVSRRAIQQRLLRLERDQ